MSRESLASRRRSTVRPDPTGTALGALSFCLSLTPSLLPRDWLTGGIIGGITAAFGYGIGVLISALVRRLVLRGRTWWPPPRRVHDLLNAAVVALFVGASMLMVVPAAGWQREISAVLGTEGPATSDYLRGHGHNYGASQLDGWVAVAAPEGWTDFDTDRTHRSLEQTVAAGGPEFR